MAFNISQDELYPRAQQWPAFILQVVMSFTEPDTHLFLSLNKEWRRAYMLQHATAITSFKLATNLKLVRHSITAGYSNAARALEGLIIYAAPMDEITNYCYTMAGVITCADYRQFLFQILDRIQDERILRAIFAIIVARVGYYNLIVTESIGKKRLKMLLSERLRGDQSLAVVFDRALFEGNQKIYKLVFRRHSEEILAEHALPHWLRRALEAGRLKEAKWLRALFYKGIIPPVSLVWAARSGMVDSVEWVQRIAKKPIPRRIERRATLIALQAGHHDVAIILCS